jgi:hypothetical protein
MWGSTSPLNTAGGMEHARKAVKFRGRSCHLMIAAKTKKKRPINLQTTGAIK